MWLWFCIKKILRRAKEKKIDTDLTLLDESGMQIRRARENLYFLDKLKFIHKNIPEYSLPRNYFDKIVMKMGLHENPKKQQVEILKKLQASMKKDGKIIIWDIMLEESNQKIFQDIIRKKDKLSGFMELAKRRYFFTEKEFLENMSRAGFRDIKEFHSISYRFSSKKRLTQELKNDKKRLGKLNSFIREVMPENMKKSMHYTDRGDDIRFNVNPKIYTARK